MAKAHESPLMRIIEVASALGAATIADDAFELADRISEGQFFCACVGQFKRGKSTFINALLGEAVLPVGVLPVTATLTVIKYGHTRSARVRFLSGNSVVVRPDELAQYVTEERNPENEKRVNGVELFWPSPLLASGLCLVDTPGIGSVYEWNTAVTQAFVPHIDAALIVLGADPPLSKDELALVEKVSSYTSTLLFALNKADRAKREEQEEAAEFTRRTLTKRLSLTGLKIYSVSSTEKLFRGEPTRDWAEMEHDLTKLADGAGKAMVAAAQERGEERMVKQLRVELAQRVELLQRPLGESQTRLDALQRQVADSERALQQLLAASGGAQNMLESEFDRRREAFVKDGSARAVAELEAWVHQSGLKGAALREGGHATGKRIAQDAVSQWSMESKAVAEKRFRETASKLVSQAQTVMERLSSAAVEGMSDLSQGLHARASYTVSAELTEADLPPALPSSASKLASEVFRSEAALRATTEELSAFLTRLLQTNAVRITSEIEGQLRHTLHRVEEELCLKFGELANVARRALSRANDRQRMGSASVSSELERLDYLRRKLDPL